jgi:hypothetical protein
MTNKILTYAKKYIWLITTVIALIGLFLSIYQARISAKSPVLKYYVVRVSPEINDNNLQVARLKLETSLFEDVNNLIAQNPSISYSEALDNVLPVSESIGDLSGGAVIVVQNQGEITARNLRINVTLKTPIENYEILSNESFSIIEEDKAKGIVKISVDRLTSEDKIQIAVLFPGAYKVTLIASRASQSTQPPPNTTLGQMAATQTAVASSKQEIGNSLKGFLQFYTENNINNIQINVFVSSDEVQGEINSAPKDISQESYLFYSTFQP